MGQGWKMLPLVVFLLFWRTADGLKGSVYSNSDISEAHVTETLPVEEVGSTLFPNKPFRSRSKLNLLQFVKGGSSSDQSVSYDRTAPSTYASASLPLPLVQRPSSSLFSGSTVPGVASQLNLGTQYAASDSGLPIYRGSSYPAVLGISGQSNRDTLHVASSKGILMLQSAEAPLPVFSQSTSYSSSSAPGAASTSQSSPVLHSESSGQPLYPQGEGSLSKGASIQHTSDSSTKLSSTISHLSSGKESTQSWFNSRYPGVSGTFLTSDSVHSIPTQVGSYSGVSQSLTASSPYTPGSLTSNKLDASQSTNAQSSPIVSTSNTQSRSGMPLVTSSHVPVQGSSSSTRLSLKPPGTLGQYTPTSPIKYISGPTSSRTSHSAVSPVGSLSQMESSGVFPSRGGNHYSGLLPQSQANSGKYALGYSKPISSPQSTSSQSASVSNSRKPYISAFQDTPGAQFGALQGMSNPSSGSVPYSVSSSVYCKCALSPLDVDRQTTTVHHSREHFTSNSDTQSESSTPFTLQGSITYDGSPQQKVIASQFAPVSHSFSSASSQSSTVQDFQEPLPSTDMGSSGTQAGSSTLFTLQHPTSGGSSQPQHTTSQFSPGLPSSYPSLSLASPLGVASQSASTRQFTSASQGSSTAQLGASALFASGSMSSRYSGSVQSQDAASQFAPGSKPSYTSLSVSFPKVDAGPTLQSSRKPFISTFTGSSGTQAGSSSLTLQGSSASGGSSLPQNNANLFSPGWPSSYHGLSSPLGVASPSSSRKPFTSTFTGSSGTQAGSSSLTLQGSSASGGSPPQDAVGQFVPGSSSASVSSSTQSAASQSSQAQPGYSVSQRWQPSSTHWTQGVPTSDAGALLGSSSSQSSPIQLPSQSSAGGSTSRVSSLFVSAPRGSTSHDGSFQSQSSSTKYTPGSQVLPYDPSVAAQGTSSVLASGVLSGSSSLNNQNAPAPSRSSTSRRVYPVKG